MSSQIPVDEVSINETASVVILKHMDQALLGVADGFDSGPCAVYSSKACIQEIQCMEDVDFTEALVYFNLNIRIRHAPTGNPIFLNDLGEGWASELSRLNAIS